MEFKSCAKDSKEAQNIAEVYNFMRAVADPNRLKILCLLRGGSLCVCKIVTEIKISDKLVSHHLKQLKKAGLLNEKREGNFIYYSLNKKIIKENIKNFNQIIK